MTLRDLVERNLALFAGCPAIVFQGRRLTYRDFTARAFRLANALLEAGVAPQDRVAMLAQNCPQYLEFYAACEVAGLIAVPLNHRLAPPELVAIARDCTPAVIIAQEEFLPLAEELGRAVPGIRRLIRLPGGEYEALLAAASPEAPRAAPAEEDIAYLMYTSGTTGRPKGVMLSHRAVALSARALAFDGGTRPDDRALICMPYFHIGGRIEQLSFTVQGATILLHAGFEERAILRSIAEERATAAHLAPTMIQRLLDCPDFAAFDLASLRLVHYASAPMPVPLLRRAIGALGPIFAQVYGMTECIIVSVLKPHQHVLDGDGRDQRRLASAGQPFLGCSVRIEGAGGEDAPPGEAGEILVRSPGLMSGYWNDTAGALAAVRQGWLRTQDLGTLDADGFLTIVDRKKDMIVSGGENIYSWEVEEALRSHPAVSEAAVIGVPDELWGERVQAYVVLHAGRHASEADLVAHCRARIASYKKPRGVAFVAALPRMFHGKIDKKALRAPHWAGRERAV